LASFKLLWVTIRRTSAIKGTIENFGMSCSSLMICLNSYPSSLSQFLNYSVMIVRFFEVPVAP
jgi:hypothetical protein